MGGRILIVDDDDAFRRTLARALKHEGYDVSTAANAAEAKVAMRQEAAEVVLLDYQLPDADGLALLEELKGESPGSVFLIATAYPSVDMAVEAMRQGAFDYIAKGEINECLVRVERAGEVASLRRRVAEAHRANTDDSGLLGESAPMRRLKTRLAALAGADDTTVLIIGETGTGKGVIARWIHANSGRAYESLVAVDCTTIPATLVESELFGHEKGSFSGATTSKVGRVEAAGRGTLFLDEIGELELPIQAKLLRLLEEREYSRVGSTRMRSVESRIVTATNRDLAKAVKEGRFRADLRFRLEVFVIETPPLRERGDDILLLTQHFVAKHARALGREEPLITPPLQDALLQYPFPGNVRELRNMVEQAVLLGGEQLVLGDFPVLSRIRRPAPTVPSPELDPVTRPIARVEDIAPTTPPATPALPAMGEATLLRPPGATVNPSLATAFASGNAENLRPLTSPHQNITVPAPKTLASIREGAAAGEKVRLIAALEASAGNVSAAARQLGLSRYQLLRRLKKHQLR